MLAQPQLRVTEGEKANLLIGDQVPIPVTSFNTANTIGGNVVPITSFQYKDVGIQIEVEPRVHHNREITLELKVEISNVGETVQVGPDQEAITIGTRTITSVIRLKSGESSLLAGLIRRDKTKGVTKTPILGDIPLLGRLFRNEEHHRQEHRSGAHPDSADHPLPRHRRGGSGAGLGRDRKPDLLLRRLAAGAIRSRDRGPFRRQPA